MAIRIIRKEGDEILRKKSKEVTAFDARLSELIDDMFETMYEADGVGLAAVQVGSLRRVVTIDTRIEGEKIELVNPVIVYRHGSREVLEACLSVPDKHGYVVRPEKVIVRAKNRYGEECEYIGEGLLAQAICHECDHLEGELFIDKVVRYPEDE